MQVALSQPVTIPLALESLPYVEKKSVSSTNDHQNIPTYQYKIQLGDNINKILSRLEISLSDQKALLTTDQKAGWFRKLVAGDNIYFWKTELDGVLYQMDLVFNPVTKVRFAKLANGSYTAEELVVPGKWQQEVLAGEFLDSPSISLYRVGLSFDEIDRIKTILRSRLNFALDVRRGDKFSLVRSLQYIGGKPTNHSQIEAIRIHTKARTVTAYLHVNGLYYDEIGLPIENSFLRYPTHTRPKISSSFDPKRLHPVAMHFAPHHGTDFYANTGTPVLAIADGIVKVARFHPIAGNYVVIDHGEQVVTRYLHNDELMVYQGQFVRQGEVIALSGATGRVTGAHIHYELIVRGKAVDAMRAYLPRRSIIARPQLRTYLQLVNKYDKIMDLAGTNGILLSEKKRTFNDNAVAIMRR
ncbi:MAG: peptidoglycan DD-metalloendopeptidase family protein [Vibrionaceae bacterium]